MTHLPSNESSPPTGFDEILTLIRSARQRALQAVNVELIDLYWQVGQTISRKIEAAEWGAGIVDQLAGFLARTQPGLKGFTRSNLLRMRQFYELYHSNPIVAPLVRQLPWTHNLIILSQSKHPEEREFYLRLAAREKWSKRELERQFRAALFERTVLDPPRVSPLTSQIHPDAAAIFKDTTFSISWNSTKTIPRPISTVACFANSGASSPRWAATSALSAPSTRFRLATAISPSICSSFIAA